MNGEHTKPVESRTEDLDDEPGVLGAGSGPAPMPSQEDIQSAYKRLYIARFVEKGFDAADALFCFEANGPYDDMTPEEAADEDMSCFEDDGDGPID